MAASETQERTLAEFVRHHRRAFLVLLAAAAGMVFVLAVVPQIAGFGDTLRKLRNGDKSWLALAAGLEVLSIGGYVAAFRGVFCCEGVDIGWHPEVRPGNLRVLPRWVPFLIEVQPEVRRSVPAVRVAGIE